MKKVLCLLLLAAMALPLTGCDEVLINSGMTFMSVSSQTSESFRMSYEQFDGMKQYRLKTRQDDTTVRVEVETQSGTLNVKVTAAGGEDLLVYYAENLQTGSYTFDIPEAGKYTVTVTAEKHSGRFSFDWSK